MHGELIDLPALGPSGPYRAYNRRVVPDVTGAPFAELSMAPRLFVDRALAALRSAPAMPLPARVAALTEASRVFLHDNVSGMSFEDYAGAVSRVSGVPVSVVRRAGAEIANAAVKAESSAYGARPVGAAADWRDTATLAGRGVWTRRGEVFAVHAAGNHPAPHALWLEALALGYRVAVRPSRREPFTPYRLVSALRAAGFGDDRVVLLPTDHGGADVILAGADLGLVYGGDEVVAKYAGDTTVRTQGPGRSKILVTASADWRDHLDLIVDSVAAHAGVACLNTTTVLVQGDPGPLAAAIAERLAALPSLPPQDDRAVLPVTTAEAAEALERYLRAQAGEGKAWLGGAGIVDELGDGSAVLRPSVYQLDAAPRGGRGVELPFPCVWVAPWSPADGLAPLRETLVLTVLTDDESLVDRLLVEPSISNVYLGDHPTHWLEPGVPHDGYLGEFLMRGKTVIRG
ncbi:aldehyde dehydrogenase family protein [Actinokineospora sp. NBRC 105648]|uniref:aldehyde dehydrogenase family protein n=1 Tax=Actinokineospora sp. NBRC 105648 TaxID=3032206 RepID=UPI0024A04B0D|nr:aldehyde dehydrogenase family protein [Actinokineospora sp. NBRC 105648]GLZ36593.1 aldehyde dehydrogenase [Actinokineospora sp. NBRC 105648]